MRKSIIATLIGLASFVGSSAFAQADGAIYSTRTTRNGKTTVSVPRGANGVALKFDIK